ncbi:helix-turn-helix domain-containing protein [Rhodococcus sp. IEGM 1354]|uniref:helix-turn-helix domain-containing protein n=1 Tax=Rhodococcus sp. IEGM 1354 TaxID=3047088 RepID=UPI003FA7EB68
MDLVRWVTEREAAELVNRSPRTLRVWRQRGQVNAFRQVGIRGLILYEKDSVRECAAAQAMRLHQSPGRPPTE